MVRRKSKAKIIRKVMGYSKAPPKTTRYCMYCRKMRKFVYNKFIGHSECKVCGCRVSRRNHE